MILSRGIATICIFRIFELHDIVDLELGVVSAMINEAYLFSFVNYFVFLGLFPPKLCVLFDEGILSTPVQKDDAPPVPWLYRVTIYENPIPLKLICVLSYHRLLLTKLLFET